MTSVLRPFRRVFPHCSVTYNAGFSQGLGVLWDFTRSGRRLSENFPIRPAESLSLTVTLPNEQRIEVPEAGVQWSSGQEFSCEVVIEPHCHACVQHEVNRLVQKAMEMVL